MQTDNTCSGQFIYNQLIKQFSISITIYSILLLAILIMMPFNSYGLTLQQAEKLALLSDPLVESHQASARALIDKSVADGTLPDPKLRLGMFNVPTDTFSTSQEPTTQLRLGLQQQFPRGDVLNIKTEQSVLKSQAAQARAEDARRKILRDLRETFLNIYYESEAARIIADNKNLFSKLVQITEDQYAAGRANQQDVIRANLELARLDDRYIKILSKQDQYRAVLAQWIRDAAWQKLDRAFPVLPKLQFSNLNALLTQHPLILAQSSEVDAARKMTEIAKQDYKPGFNAFVEYRKRYGEDINGIERTDMMAAMVTLDIPFFTENRQDKNVSASEEKANSARYILDDKLRVLKKIFEKNKAMFERSSEREILFKESLLASAKSNSAAALNAYQSGVTEFTTLMRAQITELDVLLNDLRARVDTAIAKARLLYITGE